MLKKFSIILLIIYYPSSFLAQSRFEIDVSISYASPRFESYGTNVILGPNKDLILIDGERILSSDNFGTENGYSLQVNSKYRITGSELLKGIFNIGYTRLYSHHEEPQTDYGVKLQSLSFGLGAELTPYSKLPVIPSIVGIFRLNFVGGETFHLAGIDFFKVTGRYGYSAGIKLAYPLNQRLNLFTNWNFSYENLWNKQENEETPVDAHVIVFRDKQSNTNGLAHDRRFAYVSFGLGMTIKFY